MDAIPHAPPAAVRPADQSRLNALAHALDMRRVTLRYVDYRQAERDCEELAAAFVRAIPRSDLASFSFTAIPRGGLIVLGMLSYMLDLRPSQLDVDLASGRPLCAVDDCALSGARLSRLLARTGSPYVVVAHLYSHPDLRQAVLEREQRVKHCLAAHDLVDHGPEHYPVAADYRAWQERRRERLGGNRYWAGQPELVCFAWSEPDAPFWNQQTEKMEDGWRFLPPDRCLKNRTRLGVPPRSGLQPYLRVPGSLVWGLFDDVIWLCDTGSDLVYSLDGIAADMWRTLAAYGDADAAAQYLLSEYEVDEQTMRSDLGTFSELLLARHALERVDNADASHA